MLKRVWDLEVLMFDINLLSKPGLQFEDMPDGTISFIKEKVEIVENDTIVKKEQKVWEKIKIMPTINLYTVIFIAIVGVIFYPMISKNSFSIQIQSERISQDVVIDKVLKVILQSKNDYIIESIQFFNGNILISLTSFDMPLMKLLQKELDVEGNGSVRIFGGNNNYSMIAKLPWEILNNNNSITSPETFFDIVNIGKNVQTIISQDEIAMRGSISDIITIFLQLANAERLQSNEMVIHSIDADSLIFAIKLSN